MKEFRQALEAHLAGQLDAAALQRQLILSIVRQPHLAAAHSALVEAMYRSGRVQGDTYLALIQAIRSAQQSQGAATPPTAGSAAPGPAPPAPPGKSAGAEPAEKTQFRMPASRPAPPPLPPATGNGDGEKTQFRMPRSPAGPVVAPPSAPAAPPKSSAPLPPARPSTPPPPAASASPPSRPASGGTLADLLGGGADSDAAPPAARVPTPAPPRASVPPPAAPKVSAPEPGPSTTGNTGGGFAQTTGGFTDTGASSGSTGGTGTGTGTGGKSGSSWSHPSHWTNQPGEQLGPGSVIKDRFVLEEMIGRGGMGIVFKARDQRKEEAQDRNPHVAIKVLNEEFKRHPESLKALQRESRKAQKLAHPNVVTVFDFDRDGANVFMVMELLEGESLDRVIKTSDGAGIGVKEAIAMAKALCAALAYAHEQGVVHSDFKPANAYKTDAGVIKVFDFGIARAARRMGDVKGETTLFDAGTLGALTPAYASCEMIEGLEPDARDDIYALACVVYELLTGHHPFKKMSAVQARDSKQVPKRPHGLSSRQWKGLLRGLAFDRNERSPSVEQFLYDITPQRRSQPLYIGIAAAILAVVVSVGMLLPGYLEKRHIRGLVEAVKTLDPAVVDKTLPEINKLPPDQRAGVLFELRDTLEQFAKKQVAAVFDPRQKRYDYGAAEAIVERMRELDRGSLWVAQLADKVTSDREAAISDQSDSLDECLRKGWLLPSQNPQNVQGVLEAVRKLNPNHQLLKDGRLALAYGEQANTALKSNNVALAQALVTAGLQLAPEDTRLRDARDAVSRLTGAQQRQMRVAQLRRGIEGSLGPTSTLASIDQRRADLEELKSLDQDDATLQRAQQLVQRQLDREIDALASKRSFEAAQALLAKYAGLSSSTYVETKRANIARLDREYSDRVASLTGALATAIRERRLDAPAQNNALAILGQLQAAGVEAARLSNARDQIAQGYATSASEARWKEKWTDARTLVDRGVQLKPTQSVIDVLEAERQEINQAEKVAKSAADEQQRRQLLAQRQAEDRKLTAQLVEGLKPARLNIEDARRLLALADNLERRQVRDPQVVNARRDIQGKLVAEITALRTGNKIDEAIRVAETANGLIPAAPVLEKALVDARAASAQRTVQQRDAAIAEIKGRVDGLLRAPKLDDRWEADLASQFDKLGAYVATSDSYVVGARQRAGAAYISQARQWRAQGRFSEADRMLKSAERYVTDQNVLTEERNLLAAERTRQDVASVERKRLAEVTAMKQKLVDRARAEEISEAIDVLKELKKVLPATDTFLAKDGPAAICNAYVGLASQAARRGDFDGAAGLLAQAIEYGPARTDIGPLRDRYLRVSPIDKSLKSDTRINVAQVRQQLGGIERADQSGYNTIKQGLATNLSRRITTVRARDPELADQLTRAALDLFPDTPVLAGLQTRGPAPAAATPEPAKVEPKVASTGTTPTGTSPGATAPGSPVAATAAATASSGTAPATGSGPIAPVAGDAQSSIRSSGGAPCRPDIAGFGRRGARGICYDNPGGVRGPEMVVVPGGTVGDAFAISRYEITVGDYANYCRQSGECNPGGGQQDLPITAISVANAEKYAAWLSRVTGAQYRLPTDAEWTYAASAQGGAAGQDSTNCVVELNGNRLRGGSLLTVRSGSANAWGLYNSVGNAQEFARSGGGWVTRGGMFKDTISQCVIATSRPSSGGADETTGFRLVRNVGGAS